MNIQKKQQQGFTLIELMIVIAIVGILAAVALPAYQDYTVRAKMSEPLAILAEAKTTVSEYFVANARFPDTEERAGIRTNIDTDIVASLNLVNEVLIVTMQPNVIPGDAAGDAAFELSLIDTSSGAPEWRCRPIAGNVLETKFLPANCRG